MNHIDISEIVQDFYHHVLSNKNIILSGSFGSGKSYMLDEFKRTYANIFNAVTIYPINYAISGNADILEYIKHDIIFQLVLQGYITEQTDFSAVSSAIFTKENVAKLTSRLLDRIPGGGLIAEAINAGLEAKERYDSEKKTVSKFLEGFNRVGSIYERDAYTEMIRLGLDACRREGKQLLLIIEDLDRIDPQNIFRLLNVFGSHLDSAYVSGEDAASNKFGFDKIIFVLDYKQTENVYCQYFGLETSDSWHGYISKFLTSSPFNFVGVEDVAKHAVIRQISQDCGLRTDLIETILTEEFSMRTLSKVSFDTFNTFLRVDRIDLPGGDYFMADNKLSRLLYYFCQLNASLAHIKEMADDAPYEFIGLMASALLYYHQCSRLHVEFIVPNRESAVYDDINDEDDIDKHYHYLIKTTGRGTIEVEDIGIPVSPIRDATNVELESEDWYFQLQTEILGKYSSEITRYDNRNI